MSARYCALVCPCDVLMDSKLPVQPIDGVHLDAPIPGDASDIRHNKHHKDEKSRKEKKSHKERKEHRSGRERHTSTDQNKSHKHKRDHSRREPSKKSKPGEKIPFQCGAVLAWATIVFFCLKPVKEVALLLAAKVVPSFSHPYEL